MNINEILLDSAKAGYLEKVKLLIANGADLNAKNDDGWTPLNLASRYRYLEVAKFIETHIKSQEKPKVKK